MNEKIICAGFGGQGIMLLGQLLAYAANEKQLNSLWVPSYGPETRGGTANCSVTISTSPINSPVISKADHLIIMNGPSLDKFESRLTRNGHAFVNSSLVNRKINQDTIHAFYIPVNDLAMGLGNIKVANMVMLGAFLEVTKLFDPREVIEVLKESFGEEKSHLIKINEQALESGANYIRK